MKNKRYSHSETDTHVLNMFKGTRFAREWQKNVSEGRGNLRTINCDNLDTEDFSKITSKQFGQLINDRFSWDYAPQGFSFWSNLHQLFVRSNTLPLYKKIEEILADSSNNNKLFKSLFEGVSAVGDGYEIF